jgi:hypothetical protein
MISDTSQTTRTKALTARTLYTFHRFNPTVTEKDASVTIQRNMGPESRPNGYCCNPVVTVPVATSNPDPLPPSGLPTASLWFDASDTQNIAVSGGNITEFTDKTGNNNNGTAYDETPISYNPNSINGLGTVRFDNASGPVETLKVTNENFNDQFLTYAIVARWISGSSGMVATDTPGLFGRGIGISDVGGGIGKLQTISYNAFTTWDGSPAPDITIPQNTPFILVTSISAGNWIASVNGPQYTLPLTQAETPNNTEGLNFGSWNPSNFVNLIFDLGECLVYRSFLTGTEIEKVEGYFATKWGLLGNLPVGHPYKSGYP